MFYCFIQNDLDGYFIVDNIIGHYVIIESDSVVDDLNDIAYKLGICYLTNENEGCINCPCCCRWLCPHEFDDHQSVKNFIKNEKPNVIRKAVIYFKTHSEWIDL